MDKGHKETIKVRLISVGFSVLVLAIFKPFGLQVWQWEAYLHLLNIGLLGFGVCLLTEAILRFVIRKPRSYDHGVNYIIRRNLWFQFINTLLISLMICTYRHLVLSNRIDGNRLSWENFFETLIIMAFCSFAIGLYWRYKFRSRYLAVELEETRILNEQLKALNIQRHETTSENEEQTTIITLKGTTCESVTLQVNDLLYIEAVGNYVKVYQWADDKLCSVLLRATSKQMEEELRAYPMIVRCHRAFIINLDQVEQIVTKTGNMQLLVKHCHELIPVSRSYATSVKAAIRGK